MTRNTRRSPVFSPLTISVCFHALAAVLIIFSPHAVHGITHDDVNNALERAKNLEEKIPADNAYSEDMRKEAQKTYKNFKATRTKEVEAFKKTLHYDGKTITLDKGRADVRKKNAQQRHHLPEDERIYVFISSSLPKNTLINYARAIDSINEDRIAMVLRGCVTGCTRIMPTANFVRSIVNPSEGEELKVEVVIDPFLYRLYNISQVPAIVYAKNVTAINPEASEGNPDNLKGKPNSFVLLGDVGLDYALRNINAIAKSSSLENVMESLRKSWFKSKQ